MSCFPGILRRVALGVHARWEWTRLTCTWRLPPRRRRQTKRWDAGTDAWAPLGAQPERPTYFGAPKPAIMWQARVVGSTNKRFPAGPPTADPSAAAYIHCAASAGEAGFVVLCRCQRVEPEGRFRRALFDEPNRTLEELRSDPSV